MVVSLSVFVEAARIVLECVVQDRGHRFVDRVKIGQDRTYPGRLKMIVGSHPHPSGDKNGAVSDRSRHRLVTVLMRYRRFLSRRSSE